MLIYKKIAPVLAHQDDSDLRRDTTFCKDIVSSSETVHNPNICVAVIFVPKIKRKVILWENYEQENVEKAGNTALKARGLRENASQFPKQDSERKQKRLLQAPRQKPSMIRPVLYLKHQRCLSDYLDFWLDGNVKTNMTYNTYDAYASAVKLHIKPALGNYKLSALSPAAIQQWIDSLKAKGLSEQSIANYRGVLSGALKYAVYPCQYLRQNPCSYTRVPSVPVTQDQREHREYVCSSEAWSDIVDYFNGTCYYLPLMICYHTGMRIGECFGLDLQRDVDFRRHTISVNRQLQKEDKQWIYKNPKYDSFRKLKIGSTLEALLKSEITVMKMNRLRYGEYYTRTYVDNSLHLHCVPANQDVPPDYREVWPLTKENGEMLTTESIKYCTRIIKHKLGYTAFHPHSLRHTHGTILAESGASPKTIMERLGHKNIKVTMERYVYNTEKMQDEAVALFEAAIK